VDRPSDDGPATPTHFGKSAAAELGVRGSQEQLGVPSQQAVPIDVVEAFQPAAPEVEGQRGLAPSAAPTRSLPAFSAPEFEALHKLSVADLFPEAPTSSSPSGDRPNEIPPSLGPLDGAWRRHRGRGRIPLRAAAVRSLPRARDSGPNGSRSLRATVVRGTDPLKFPRAQCSQSLQDTRVWGLPPESPKPVGLSGRRDLECHETGLDRCPSPPGPGAKSRPRVTDDFG
jgi:hypothetical protein